MRRIRSLLVPMVTFALVASLGPSAGAQSEEEVAAARQAAETARRERLAAESALGDVSTELLAAIDRYQTLTARLSSATHALVDLRDEVRAREATLRDRRAETKRLIAAAYAGATRGELSLAFDADSVEDFVIVQDLLARSVAVQDSAIDDFEATRSALAAERSSLERTEVAARDLRREADAMVRDLQRLVTDAAARASGARQTERSATATYEIAVDELEAAKRSVSPAAYRWRNLVERYFPEELTWQALQVLDCESGGDPTATNADSGAAGLFQFLAGTWVFASALAGYPGADPYDPEANVASAAWLVNHSDIVGHPGGPWGHWECQPLPVED